MRNISKSISSLLNKVKMSRKLFLLSLAVVVVLSSVYMPYIWSTSMKEVTQQALKTARTAEASLNGEMLKKLSAVPEDLGTNAYLSIKDRLIKLVSVSSNIRFAYIYTQREGKNYFVADSEPVDSKDYSPPGQEYTGYSNEEKKIFEHGNALVTQPTMDQYGTWITVLVPMKDNETGEIIAVFGMDYPAEEWSNNAIYNTKKAGVATLELFLLWVVFYIILTKNKRLKEKSKQLDFANYEIKLSEEKFSRAFHSVAVLMAILSIDNGCYIDVNDAFLKTLGFDRDGVIGKKVFDLNIFIDNEQRKIIKKKFETSESFNDFEVLIKGKNGLVRTAICTADSIVMGGIVYWFTTMTDITDRKLAEEALKKSESRLIAAQLMAHVGNWELNLATKNIWASKEACNIYGIEYNSENWRLEYVQKCVIPEYRESVDTALTALIRKEEKYDEEFKIKNVKTGEEHFVHSKAELLVEEGGNASKVVGTIQDITQRKEKELEIFYLSYHDQLTGLYNRRFYEEELKRLDTERNLPITIVMGDVNGLKLINDSFGHVMGDELLKKVGGVIKRGCRTDEIIARLGGDEFVILLPKTNTYETEQIIKRITKLSLNEKVGFIDISISFGYATKSNGKEKIEDIFKNAEDQMYKKKLFEGPNVRDKTIESIINALHEKNRREEAHSYRVSELCKRMGQALQLPKYEINELMSVGALHDIGKIAIDENILNKSGILTEDEWKEIKCHPEIGYRILNTVNDMSDVARYILCHHERWDGKGYPKGLKGDKIPFISRIITIVDAYDAMTSERSYLGKLTEEVAIAELQKNAGTQFDPELVSEFIEKVLR